MPCEVLVPLDGLLGPPHEEREGIEDGRQEDAPKRDAKEIPLGKEDVAEQQYQAKREKKGGLEQEVAMCHGQVTIHRAEQDEAIAMTRVESDPGLPHRCLSRDERRHLLHARSQIAVAWQQLGAVEGIPKVDEAEQHEDRGAASYERWCKCAQHRTSWPPSWSPNTVQPSLRDGDDMRLDLAIHRLAAEPVLDRFRRQGSCLRQPRGIPCLDLVPQRGPLAIRDGGVLARPRAAAGCQGSHGR